MRQLFSLLVLASLIAIASSEAVAVESTKPEGAEALTATGKVDNVVSDDVVQVKISESDTWIVHIAKNQTKLEVTGTAEPGYLRAGMHIRFTGEIDAKGKLQAEVKEFEIFTPQGKNDLGLFDAKDTDPDAKPIKKLAPGTYQIRAKVLSLKENELALLAGGKKLFGTLASDAETKVVFDDFNYVEQGDEASITGWFDPKQKAAAGKPGVAIADELTIKLSKPLEAAKKPVKAAKTAKSKPRKRAADDMPEDGSAPAAEGGGSAPVFSNPFGDKK